MNDDFLFELPDIFFIEFRRNGKIKDDFLWKDGVDEYHCVDKYGLYKIKATAYSREPSDFTVKLILNDTLLCSQAGHNMNQVTFNHLNNLTPKDKIKVFIENGEVLDPHCRIYFELFEENAPPNSYDFIMND